MIKNFLAKDYKLGCSSACFGVAAKKRARQKKLAFLLVLIVLSGVVVAITIFASGGGFFTKEFFAGIAGGTVAGGTQGARFHATPFQPGSSAAGGGFSANIGSFSRVVIFFDAIEEHFIRVRPSVGRADLIITELNITFNNSRPKENENITIFANVFNTGNAAAPNVLVQFFDGGVQIDNRTISPVLSGGDNQTVSVTYVSVIGNRTIRVVVDPLNTVVEQNETNNNASRTLNVQSHTFFFGRINGNITLANVQNLSEYTWNHTDAGNVFFFDVDSKFNFSALQALGKNVTNGTAGNDFGDANLNLNMTGFNDSMQFIWAGGSNDTALFFKNFTIFGKTVFDVPVINSTNSSIFVTGILWDTQDDTNGEYDTTDKEDLVFVGNIVLNQSGEFLDNIDYEVRIPSLLRAYAGGANEIAFIAELR